MHDRALSAMGPSYTSCTNQMYGHVEWCPGHPKHPDYDGEADPNDGEALRKLQGSYYLS